MDIKKFPVKALKPHVDNKHFTLPILYEPSNAWHFIVTIEFRCNRRSCFRVLGVRCSLPHNEVKKNIYYDGIVPECLGGK